MSLFDDIRNHRWLASIESEDALWERNGLKEMEKRRGYKIESDRRLGSDGNEHTVYELWKVVDRTEVTIKTIIKREVVDGLPKEENDKW